MDQRLENFRPPIGQDFSLALVTELYLNTARHTVYMLSRLALMLSAELSSCNRDPVAYKDGNVYYLAF